MAVSCDRKHGLRQALAKAKAAVALIRRKAQLSTGIKKQKAVNGPVPNRFLFFCAGPVESLP